MEINMLLKFTGMDISGSHTNRTGQYKESMSVKDSLVQDECIRIFLSDIFKECKTFKAGKKTNNKKKPHLSLKCLNTSLNRQAFNHTQSCREDCSICCLDVKLSGRGAEPKLFSSLSEWSICWWRWAREWAISAVLFYSHILFPLNTNTENQEQLLWRNAILYDDCTSQNFGKSQHSPGWHSQRPAWSNDGANGVTADSQGLLSGSMYPETLHDYG